MNLAIIVGSTRPGRNCTQVAEWVSQKAFAANDFCKFASIKVVDIADQSLPFLDEPSPAIYGNYTKEHTKKWSALINGFDAFIFVTPEYNQSIPGVLKNAIDFLAKEWASKSAAIVCYGGGGGLRACEHLRQVLGGVKLVPIPEHLSLTLTEDFVGFKSFKPREEKQTELLTLLNSLSKDACKTCESRKSINK